MGAAFAFHQSFRHVNLVDKQDELTIINLGNLNLWKIFADLNSSGIYLSGETVKCQVTFFNTHEFHPETVQDKLEHLAWASVQLQCICQVATPSGSASRRESESVAPSLDSLTTLTSLQPQKDAFNREVFATK